MKNIKYLLLAVMLTSAIAWRPLHLAVVARKRTAVFRVTFLSGVTPANIVLHADYTGPANPAAALYDAGDGVWTAYTSNTIAIAGNYVAFRGDWRNAAGGYNSMFRDTFKSAAYTCAFSGALKETPSAFASCYRRIFNGCTAVVRIEDNPLPILTGSPAAYMFRETCDGMSGVTALPAGFMDTSGLTGSPAEAMFYYACNGMSGVTNSLPAGFMDTSGLTGSPAEGMLKYACNGMSSLSGGNMYVGTNITMTTTNLSTLDWLDYTMSGCSSWTGQMYYGAAVIHTVITPTNDLNTFENCVNMPDYGTINANWK